MKAFFIGEDINYKSTLVYLKSLMMPTKDDFEVANKIIEENKTCGFAEIVNVIKNCICTNNDKTAYIILGNIGSGKSTLIHVLSKDNFFSNNSEFILEDIYKQIFFSKENIPLKTSYGYAKSFLGIKLVRAISLKKNIVIEMVPSSEEKIELLKCLKYLKYKIVICYIKTGDIEINKKRVKNRIANGADFVSLEKVDSREKLTCDNLGEVLTMHDELFVFISDTSSIKLIEHSKKLFKE